MTDNQRKAILELRQQGQGYTAIGDAIGLSKGSVKSYCRIHGLAGVKATSHAPKLVVDRCKNCGAPLVQRPKMKRKKFCSPACRRDWWNTRQGQDGKGATYHYVCAGCGKKFTAYGNPHRKYCSHQCYITARFKAGVAA